MLRKLLQKNRHQVPAQFQPQLYAYGYPPNQSVYYQNPAYLPSRSYQDSYNWPIYSVQDPNQANLYNTAGSRPEMNGYNGQGNHQPVQYLPMTDYNMYPIPAGHLGSLPNQNIYQPMNNLPHKQPVNPFQNPLFQQDEDFYQPPHVQPDMNITHPYPKQSFMQKNTGGLSSVINQFKTQEGSIDFNKMIDTAGQMMNSMNQVTNLVKGVGSIFKPGN